MKCLLTTMLISITLALKGSRETSKLVWEGVPKNNDSEVTKIAEKALRNIEKELEELENLKNSVLYKEIKLNKENIPEVYGNENKKVQNQILELENSNSKEAPERKSNIQALNLISSINSAKKLYRTCVKSSPDKTINSKLLNGLYVLDKSESSLLKISRETSNFYNIVNSLRAKELKAKGNSAKNYKKAIEDCIKVAKELHRITTSLSKEIKKTSGQQQNSTQPSPTLPTTPLPPTTTEPVINTTIPTTPLPSNTKEPKTDIYLSTKQSCSANGRAFPCTIPDNTLPTVLSVVATKTLDNTLYSCGVNSGLIESCDQIFIDITQNCREGTTLFPCSLPDKTFYNVTTIIATKNSDATSYYCLVTDGMVNYCTKQYLPEEHICNNGTILFKCTTPPETLYNVTTVEATQVSDGSTYDCPVRNGTIGICKRQFLEINHDCGFDCTVPERTPFNATTVIATKSEDRVTYLCKIAVDGRIDLDTCREQYLAVNQLCHTVAVPAEPALTGEYKYCVLPEKTQSNQTSVIAKYLPDNVTYSCVLTQTGTTPKLVSCKQQYFKIITECDTDAAIATTNNFDCSVPENTSYLSDFVLAKSFKDGKTYKCTNNDDGRLKGCALIYLDVFKTCKSIDGTTTFGCTIPPDTLLEAATVVATKISNNEIYECSKINSGAPEDCKNRFLNVHQSCKTTVSVDAFNCSVADNIPYDAPKVTAYSDKDLAEYTCDVLDGKVDSTIDKCVRVYVKTDQTCTGYTGNPQCTLSSSKYLVEGTNKVYATLLDEDEDDDGDSKIVKVECEKTPTSEGTLGSCKKLYLDMKKCPFKSTSNQEPCLVAANTLYSVPSVNVKKLSDNTMWSCVVSSSKLTSCTLFPNVIARKYNYIFNKSSNYNKKAKIGNQKNARSSRSRN